jgi:signal transduction histidine kinase/ketosteroid isomerase-like protein
MKVTAALKKELSLWFDTFWSTYLKGDIETWATFVRDDYKNIGGTKAEIWNSKQEIIEYTNTIMDQFLGTADIRNREIEVIPYGDYFMVHEFTDLYLKIDGEWTFYAPFRMSSLMEKTETGWITFHQHGSYPDMKALEGEAFSLDALKTENIRLQEGIKARTLELEEKNRELEIEAALERVRARSMAMQSSNELREVILEVLKKLQALGISMEQRAAAIFTFEDGNKDYEQWVASPEYNAIISLPTPYFDHPVQNDIWEARQNGTAFYAKSYSVEDKNSLFSYLFKLPALKDMPKAEKTKALKFKYYDISMAFKKNAAVVVVSHSGVPLTDAENGIIQRLSKVFDQTYTRFLDLQKVEKQAKEAKIEAALERIRASTMAMHKSHELAVVVKQINRELLNLNINLDNTQILTDLTNDPQKGFNIWIAVDGMDYLHKFRFPYLNHAVTHRVYKNQEKQIAFYSDQVGKEEKNSYYKLVYKYSDFKTIPKERQKIVFDAPGWTRGIVFLSNSVFILSRFKKEAFNEEETEIFLRFGKVFEQAYTRFLDLQKVEKQAKEAKIEAALERIRASTMAMHKSHELAGVVKRINRELLNLNIHLDTTQILTDITNDPQKGFNIWIAVDGIDYLHKFHFPYLDHAITQSFYKNQEKKIAFYSEQIGEEEKNSYFKLVFKYSDFKTIPKERQKRVFDAPGWTRGIVFLTNSILVLSRYRKEAFNEEETEIFVRIGKVCEQAYTRFLDLQKAESQAREAQIETAIEKVRASSMSIQKSDELIKVVQVVNKEIKGLGIEVNNTQIITDFEDPKKGLNIWFVAEGQDYLEKFHLNYVKHPISNKVINATKNDIDCYREIYSKKEKNEFLKLVFQSSDFINIPKERQELLYDAPGLVRAVVLSKNSIIIFQRYYLNEFTKEQEEIFKRFGKVFEQAYTRFLDLKKAEEQARESQIEAALERVRSRSMAMHKSNELRAVVSTIYHELRNLKVNFHVACIQLLLDDSKDIHLWIGSEDGVYKDLVSWPYVDIRIMNEVYQARINASPIEICLSKTETKEFFEEYFKVEGIPKERKAATASVNSIDIVGYFQANTSVFIMRYTEGVYTEDEKMITERFSKVFEQTYTRFLDLQKAEAREREAVKQASLDRVRGEIASMRTAKDLERITPLVWKELTALGVPFFRCGVFIIREDEEMVHAYLSTPDGKSVAALHIPFSDDDNLLIKPAVNNWRNQRPYREEWNQEQFIQQTRSFMEKGQIENPQSYQIMETPPERLVLHLVPFRQGMLYVGHSEDLNEEQLALVESLALTFSVAYSRYEDFKALEDTKNSLELTLKDLKSTQTQLIQAEKMASLGELTAGIAHEIQNPLNFVNNFSEVSKELLEEMLEDLKNGDIEEVDAIASDVIANLEKILHHGQRADGIVKGMLQHSRSNSGKKELTDINQLVDEYLRLAYHGLRAKDKSFNASLETDFDDSIEQQEFIAQDIGRVVLNLITNAFYACNQKTKSLDDTKAKSFQPTIKVSTKNLKNHLEIIVEDNGNGIPKQIIDKIFQPFFTTKPTGEGTGLGLSLSYDIIKAHGGTLNV